MTPTWDGPEVDERSLDSLSERIRWNVTQVQNIDAKLTERRGLPDESVLRARTIRARNYRLEELRLRKTQRHRLLSQGSTAVDLLGRARERVPTSDVLREEIDDYLYARGVNIE